MQSIAQRIFSDSAIGSLIELPKAGTPLENAYVYDASAREIKGMAAQGLVKVVDEDRSDDRGLICRMSFQRLR